MIGRLHGTLLEKHPPWIVIDVQGVGYELETSMTTLVSLPVAGEAVRLYTHLSVREDAHLLYGFFQDEERQLFRALIKVNGVGPKLALAILSGMDTDAFIHCVMEGDSKALTKLPGVGKKTADRLIVEMRDRFPHWQEGQASLLGSENAATMTPTDPLADAEAALVTLGYKPTEASRMLSSLDKTLPTEALIKAALSRQLAG
jgi:Holliday junction DNA helicase RuvA